MALELDRAVESIGQLVDQLTERRRSEELPTVVLAGRPNAGKSSLFNALAAGRGAHLFPTSRVRRAITSMQSLT